MATQDGYIPYGTNLTAAQCVEALHNGYELFNTLKSYSRIYQSATPPSITDVYNGCEFWYNTANDKLYRSAKNDEKNVVAWFEI